jgi:hypothetical protein
MQFSVQKLTMINGITADIYIVAAAATAAAATAALTAKTGYSL